MPASSGLMFGSFMRTALGAFDKKALNAKTQTRIKPQTHRGFIYFESDR